MDSSEKPTQPALDRRRFLAGTSAGVLGMLAAASVLRAQQAPPQKGGAPQLPPSSSVPNGRVTYSPIQGETIPLKGYKSDTIDAYVARPLGQGKFPGVVVVHHMPGWDEATIEITRKFAQHGYSAICPNLHFRGGKSTSDGNAAAMREAGGLTDASAMGDIDAAIRYLRATRNLNGKVGIIGYCSGGRQVYLAACTLKGIDAAIPCYPGGVGAGNDRLTPATPVDPLDLTKDLACPLMGLFGNDDKRPSPDHVAKIDAELKRLGKTYELHSFDGAGHGFFNPASPDFRPLVARDGWKMVFSWFEKHLA